MTRSRTALLCALLLAACSDKDRLQDFKYRPPTATTPPPPATERSPAALERVDSPELDEKVAELRAALDWQAPMKDFPEIRDQAGPWGAFVAKAPHDAATVRALRALWERTGNVRVLRALAREKDPGLELFWATKARDPALPPRAVGVVAEVAAQMKDPSAQVALVRRNAPGYEAVLRRLVERRDPTLAGLLAEKVREPTLDPEVAALIVQAVDAMPPAEGETIVREALGRSDARIREAALEAFQRNPEVPPSLLEPVVAIARNPNDALAAEGLRALARFTAIHSREHARTLGPLAQQAAGTGPFEGSPEFLRSLGVWAQFEGRLEAAEAIFRRGLAVAPPADESEAGRTGREIQAQLAMLLTTLGRCDEVRAMAKAFARSPATFDWTVLQARRFEGARASGEVLAEELLDRCGGPLSMSLAADPEKAIDDQRSEMRLILKVRNETADVAPLVVYRSQSSCQLPGYDVAVIANGRSVGFESSPRPNTFPFDHLRLAAGATRDFRCTIGYQPDDDGPVQVVLLLKYESPERRATHARSLTARLPRRSR